jgi:hypothetical protein
MFGAEAANLTDVRNSPGQLADPRTGKRAAGGPRSLDRQGKARSRHPCASGRPALRRHELAELEVEKIQMREGRWVIADLGGKGGRIRTVAIPVGQQCDRRLDDGGRHR